MHPRFGSGPRSSRSPPTGRASRRRPTPSSCPRTRTRSTRCPQCSRRVAQRQRNQPLPGCRGHPPARAPGRSGSRSASTRCTSAPARCRSSRSCIQAAAGARRRGRLRLAFLRGLPGPGHGRRRDERAGSRTARTAGTTCPRWPPPSPTAPASSSSARPNNPTSTIVTAGEFAAFMAEVPPTTCSCCSTRRTSSSSRMPLPSTARTFCSRYPNLVVLRTFSKAYGLAGLRIGYAVGAGVHPGCRARHRDPAVGDRAGAARRPRLARPRGRAARAGRANHGRCAS